MKKNLSLLLILSLLLSQPVYAQPITQETTVGGQVDELPTGTDPTEEVTTTTTPEKTSKEMPTVGTTAPVANEKISALKVHGALASGTDITLSQLTYATGPIKKDGEFIAGVLVTNEGDAPLENVTFALTSLDDSPFELGATQVESLTATIPAKSNWVFKVVLKAKEDLKESTYPLSYTVTAGEKTATSQLNMMVVVMNGRIDHAKIPGLTEIIKAVSEGLATMTTAICPTKPIVTEPSLNPVNIPNEDPSQYLPSEDTTMQIPALSGQAPADTSNVIMPGGSSNDTSSMTGGENVKNKPKLIINNYSLEPAMAKAGQEFTMKLSFYNTNSDYSVRNIKIYLTSDSGAPTVTGQSGSGSVFTPVNSSNTFYISRINPEETASKSITMSVIPNATAQNYVMTAHFEYEDRNGNQYTAQELIGIPVVQEARLDSAEVQLGGEMMAGNGTPVDLDFYNTGKDTLTNLMVSVEGNFTADTPKLFIGNFAPGSSEHFNSQITPNEAGPVNGKIVFTYEDSTGKEQRVEKEFTGQAGEGQMGMGPDENGFVLDEKTGMYLNIKTGEMVKDPSMASQPQGTSPLKLAGIGLAIVIVIIGVTVFLKKRRAKKQDDDLKLDE